VGGRNNNNNNNNNDNNNNNNNNPDDDDEDDDDDDDDDDGNDNDGIAVLSPYYLKISLAVFFPRKNILCEYLRCCICVVSYGLHVGKVPRFILLWAQKYFKPALLWDDTLQRGTLK